MGSGFFSEKIMRNQGSGAMAIQIPALRAASTRAAAAFADFLPVRITLARRAPARLRIVRGRLVNAPE
jgi:hypothetical protein